MTYNFCIAKAAALTLMCAVGAGSASGATLPCSIGNDADADITAGWCNLNPPLDFKNGDRIKLNLAPGAARVLVRLLPTPANPRTATGLISGWYPVQNDSVTVVLTEDVRDIKQISVHGGPAPFGIPLGNGNPAPALIGVELQH